MTLFNRSTGVATAVERTDSLSSNEKDLKDTDSSEKKVDVESLTVENDVDSTVIKHDEDVAVAVRTSLLHVALVV